MEKLRWTLEYEFEDEEDQFEVSDDPAKLGKATIVINAGAIDRIIDRAAVMIVERADRDFQEPEWIQGQPSKRGRIPEGSNDRW